MNYLAHLFFAEDTSESRVGNLMVDFVRGPVQRQPYSDEIMRAMRRHVAVDRFTDEHKVVHASKSLISRSRRRFAGIIVDVCYDHFLANHWSDFSKMELSVFVERNYESFRNYRGQLPSAMSRTISRMIEHDWLQGYQELSVIGRTLDGLSTRIRKPNTLVGSLEELKDNYGEMEEQFLRFFPELIQHMGKQVDDG